MPRLVDPARHAGAARGRRDSQRHRARLHPRRGRRLRRADRARLDGGLPRSRRGPARRQGVRRAGRRHHQLPLRHMIEVGRRLRGAGAVRARRRRAARARPRRRAAPPRLPRRAGVGAVQVVPEGGAARARRGVAADRSHREPTASRSTSVIATKFPTYFVRHPNKVTWLIHQYRAIYELCGTAVQRLRAHRSATSRLRDRLIALDTRGARRVDGGCSAIARNTAARLAHYNGADRRSRCTIRRRSPARCGPGRSATTCCRSAGSKRSSASTSIIRALAHVDRRVAARRRRRRPAAAAARGARRGARRRGSRDLRRRRRRRTALVDLYAGALARRVSAVRRGLRLRHARGVSRAQAGHHDDRRRRPARVRRRRRERTASSSPTPRRVGARDRAPRRRSRARARRSGDAGYERARADHVGRRRGAAGARRGTRW